MKISSISVQARDKNRVNIRVDGSYKFSLSLNQLAELRLKTGQEISATELDLLQNESQFGKLYARAMEYCFARPRSQFEVRQYLRRKTMPRRGKTGELVPGVSQELVDRVFDKLIERRYVDDSKFVDYWLENRRLKKGASQRLLRSELMAKGVSTSLISEKLQQTDRSDVDEITKIIARKSRRYDSEDKLIAYLARQGFSYDVIKEALRSDTDLTS